MEVQCMIQFEKNLWDVLTEISYPIPYPSTYSFWAFEPVYTLYIIQKHLSLVTTNLKLEH